MKLRHLAKIGSITGWGLLLAGATELGFWLLTRGDSERPPDKPEPTGEEIPEYSAIYKEGQLQNPKLDYSKQTISDVKLNPRTLEILKKYQKKNEMSRGGMVKQYKGGALVNKYI